MDPDTQLLCELAARDQQLIAAPLRRSRGQHETDSGTRVRDARKDIPNKRHPTPVRERSRLRLPIGRSILQGDRKNAPDPRVHERTERGVYFFQVQRGPNGKHIKHGRDAVPEKLDTGGAMERVDVVGREVHEPFGRIRFGDPALEG